VLYFDKSRNVPLRKFPPEIFCVGGKFSPGTFSENPPEIREDVGQFSTTFSKKNFYNFIKNFIKNFYNFIKNFYNFIKNFIKNFYNFIKNFIKNFYNFIKNFIKNFYIFLKNFVSLQKENL
jgi:hypothetical protein